MAIAPLRDDIEIQTLFDGDDLERPWPKPRLRVVDATFAPVVVPLAPVVFDQMGDREIAVRDAAVYVRRRKMTMIAVAAAALVTLALPISALGGKPASAGTTTALGSAVAGKGLYTVVAGDTVDSIATKLADGRSVAVVKNLIIAAIGSTVVVPGEQITVP